MKKTTEHGTSEPSRTDVQESRRKFLEQAGKLAVYTPPAMMLMMKPSNAFTLLSGGLVCKDNECNENAFFNGEIVQR